MELDMKGYGTNGYIKDLFPEAFSLLNVCDGDMQKHREAIKKAVHHGDILMLRGWFGDKRNQEVKAIYDEVEAEKKAGASK